MVSVCCDDKEMLGRIVSHYRVLELLGRGGMGVVYRAEDMLLGRSVALKFLPDDVKPDPLAIERFRREARTASALNHPHVCTIHEIGEDELGRPFIAMEFVEGQSLEDRIGERPLPPAEVVEFGIQIAEGLTAAHAQSIVHRDLKPSNIFVTPEGQIKILDFGLAKHALLPALQAMQGTSADTQTVITTPGVAIGTIAWMSPEQARGQELDARSDLFSFGVILYEMASGKLPFRGSTPAVLFDALLNREPAPIGEAAPGLRRITAKALEKDREARYQSAAEILADLKSLQRELETTRSPVPPVGAKRPYRRSAVLAGLAFLLAAMTYYLSRPVAPPHITRVAQVTSDGLSKTGINRANLATDGQRLYGTELLNGQLTPIQVAASGGDTSPIPNAFPNSLVRDFSPIRPELLVSSNIANEKVLPLFAIPIPAGSIRRLGDVMASDATWSPDGETLLFTRDTAVYAADASGAGVRKIAEFPGNVSRPRLSPDGKTVRLNVVLTSSTDTAIWQVRVDGSNTRRFFSMDEGLDNECCGSWTPDGRYYVFEAAARGAAWRARNIWAVREGSLRKNHPVPLTQGPLRYISPLVSRDGKRVYVIGQQNRGELVRYDARVNAFLPWLRGPSIEHVVFNRDKSRMTYISYPDGALWRSRPDGSDAVQLTFPPLRAALPDWSPDGKQIAFAAKQPHSDWQIYAVGSDGGQPRVLVPNIFGAIDPCWSLDGNTILYGPQGGQSHGIHLYELETGRNTTLPGSEQLQYPHWSPDRRYIAAMSRDLRRLMLYDFGTQTWRMLTDQNANYPTWTADGKYLYFDTITGKEPAIMRVSVPGGKLEQVVSLKNVRRPTGAFGYWSGLSPDGSPLTIRDIGTEEIYAFDVQFP